MAVASALACVIGSSMLFHDLVDAGSYERLSASARTIEDVGQGTAGGRDWAALESQNADVVAWVTVAGTNIDYPVVQRADDEWYLRHDFWGAPSSSGCPFVDSRCSADGPHVLAYGHHMGTAGTMFSPLCNAYEQESFNELGLCAWSTPGNGTCELRPLCALSVDGGLAEARRLAPDGGPDLHAWLAWACEVATARTQGWRELAGASDRAVTLVTCSRPVAGRRWRTLVVFVGRDREVPASLRRPS